MDTTKPKLLLIGDSFTWGLTAQPLDSSFADRLRGMMDMTIINTGIPIADPAQYEAIGAKYIPQLRPEWVVVMVYLGNDIMQEERPIVPFRPFYYYTNAGAMMADDDGRHLNSAQEAYDYYTHQKFFLLHPANLGENIIAKSALLSRIYSFRYRWREKMDAENAIRHMDITRHHLLAIRDLCTRNGCKLQIILIPERKEADRSVSFLMQRYKDVCQDRKLSTCMYIPDFNASRYYTAYPDGHLNNAGHAFFANAIAQYIRADARR
jgi:lysophospholipase L1-like esterase